MDFAKLPVGFAMALAQNGPAMEAFAAMTEEERNAVVARAGDTRTENQMWQLVAGLVGNREIM